MCDGRLFAPQIAAFSGHRAVQLAPLTGADSIDGLARAVLADAPARFALAGLSLGGIVAIAVALAAPGRVARLALIDTSARSDGESEMAGARERQMAAVRAGRLDEVMRDEMKPGYLAPGPGQADILDLCMAMARDLGVEAFLSQSRALRDRGDLRPALARIAAPTLVMHGGEDRLCPRDRHEEIAAAIPGAWRVEIAGAGHLPVLEQPGAANAALSRWLAAP